MSETFKLKPQIIQASQWLFMVCAVSVAGNPELNYSVFKSRVQTTSYQKC